jgi:hypothetical protein
LGHVDVVLRTASGTLNHHRWYSDQGGWDKTALTCCQRPNGAAFTLSDFVLARRGFGGDFFAYAKNDIGQNQIVMEQLQSEAIGGWFMSGGVVRAWDTTNPFYFGSSSSFHLNEAVLWNNNERLDVIGWSNFPNQNEDPVWRIYFGP